MIYLKELAEAHCAKNNLNNAEFRDEMARELWPNSSKESRGINIGRYYRKIGSKIPIEHIHYFCEKLDVSPNHLFGYKKDVAAVNLGNSLIEFLKENGK